MRSTSPGSSGSPYRTACRQANARCCRDRGADRTGSSGHLFQAEGLHGAHVAVEHHEHEFLALEVGETDAGLTACDLTGLHDATGRVADIEERTLGAGFVVEHQEALDLVDAHADLVLGHGWVDARALLRRGHPPGSLLHP